MIANYATTNKPICNIVFQLQTLPNGSGIIVYSLYSTLSGLVGEAGDGRSANYSKVLLMKKIQLKNVLIFLKVSFLGVFITKI